jgi:hypothetical protein
MRRPNPDQAIGKERDLFDAKCFTHGDVRISITDVSQISHRMSANEKKRSENEIKKVLGIEIFPFLLNIPWITKTQVV